MFKTILVGMDGSDYAKRALAFAVRLARREDASLRLAHVEEDVVGIVGKGGGPIRASKDEIQPEIERQAEELRSQGIETSVDVTSVMLGGAAPAIARIADEADADLIVVGSRGHSALAGVLLGSVAQRLLHLAKMPVMVVPSEAVPEGEETGPTSADAADRA
jgi:nucleotide-binding universal stress UspA family protein